MTQHTHLFLNADEILIVSHKEVGKWIEPERWLPLRGSRDSGGLIHDSIYLGQAIRIVKGFKGKKKGTSGRNWVVSLGHCRESTRASIQCVSLGPPLGSYHPIKLRLGVNTCKHASP